MILNAIYHQQENVMKKVRLFFSFEFKAEIMNRQGNIQFRIY